jgi:hypothetical protein
MITQWAPFLPFLVLLVLVVPLSRIASEPEASRPMLSATRSRTAERAVGLDLTRRKTFVFVSASNLSRRLDHRIEDEDGTEIGSILEQPRPGRWAGDSNFPRISKVRLEIFDESGSRTVEIVRPFGPSFRALQVTDGVGVPIGTIRRSAWRRFVLRDRFGHVVGTIVRKGWGYEVDYMIEDSAHAAVATISDFERIADRLEQSRATAGWSSAKKRRHRWGPQPDEHVLEITAPVTEELRVLMLGTAAAVFLVLQTPFFDNG